MVCLFNDSITHVTCLPLAANHKRRIVFGTTAKYGPWPFGLGYEEVDAQGQPIPGTFIDIAPCDPASPTVCVPLGSGGAAVTERWELVNIIGQDHNFHVHQAHVSVVSEQAVGGTASPAVSTACR